ncbi:DUF6221 family protein [Streptomyces avermitilis]|uniref:DUF6221 family protein n=1 Tax=Streptomyces avermitilis TaxID=33903 RepID=UPI0033CB5037
MSRDDFAITMEFLTARLREDEKAAEALKSSKNDAVAELRARVLADVEAKRRLIDWVTEAPELPEGRDLPGWRGHAWDLVVRTAGTMKLDRRRPVFDYLVVAYDGHPDFRDEWKLTKGEDEPADHEKCR